MATNSNVDVNRQPQKTYSAFNALPTLRGKDRRDSEKSPNRKYKRPPQLADQLLFPGRRLDRPHRSTYSGYSGRSLDIETIVSGGRVNGNAGGDVSSVVGGGSAKHHGSILGNGFSRSLNDVTNQPWDSLRQQLPSAHSHLSLLSRQGSHKLLSATSGVGGGGGGLGRSRGLANTLPGVSASTGNLNSSQELHSAGGGHPVPSNRWQYAGTQGGQPHRYFQDKFVRDSSSPDSSYSSESLSESEWPGPPPPIVSSSVPPPAIKLHKQNSGSSNAKKQTSAAIAITTTTTTTTNNNNNKSNKPSRRPSDNTNTSSTPQLDKILWALVPDEFANISDTGVSDLQETNSSRYLTVTDLEGNDLDSSGGLPSVRVPHTPRRPTLTQESLSQYGTSVPNDDRILRWLADCEAHTLSTSLPTHLPDISYTFKFAHSSKS